ncbi:hypothetical protein ACN27F_01770 [Solwaraspora sp. WMMB335]|uniref:hypothetical protein n=1 Tax=Solwaraspora sp. WMMB335 TaxID=3404118 RepID=UPI003B941DC7
MVEPYPALMQQLAELAAGLQARRDEAQQWHAQQCANAQAAIDELEAELADLRQAQVQARRQVDDVDREVAAIWAEASHRFGSTAARFAGLPPALSVPVGPEQPDEPRHWLAAARRLVHRSADPGALPRSAYPALVVFGVLGAAAGFGLATLCRLAGQRYGGDLAVGMPVIALVVTLLGPLLGLVPAKLLADHRHAVLDIRGSLAVLTAGLVTCAMLVVTLR